MNSIPIQDLLNRPGASRRWRRSATLPDVGGEMGRVRDDAPVAFDLLLESVMEGILVSGTIAAEMVLRCARCLKEFPGDTSVRVRELYAHRPEEHEDQYAIGDGEIDLEPCARDALVLSMPFAPVCMPDCRGLCERCGGDRNLGECSCGPEIDPRWAALGSLRLDD